MSSLNYQFILLEQFLFQYIVKPDEELLQGIELHSPPRDIVVLVSETEMVGRIDRTAAAPSPNQVVVPRHIIHVKLVTGDFLRDIQRGWPHRQCKE